MNRTHTRTHTSTKTMVHHINQARRAYRFGAFYLMLEHLWSAHRAAPVKYAAKVLKFVRTLDRAVALNLLKRGL